MIYRAVKLVKVHRHGGVDYAVGRTLVLEARQAAWLVQQAVATWTAMPDGAGKTVAPPPVRRCCGR